MEREQKILSWEGSMVICSNACEMEDTVTGDWVNTGVSLKPWTDAGCEHATSH